MGACQSRGRSGEREAKGAAKTNKQSRSPLPRDEHGKVDLLELLKRPPTCTASGSSKAVDLVLSAAKKLEASVIGEGFTRRNAQADAAPRVSETGGMPCLLLSGSHPTDSQKAFDAKPVERHGERGLDCLSKTVGYVCTKGSKKACPDMPNQDHFIIAQANRTAVYGVFDGHGPKGHLVSSYAATKIVQHMTCHPWFKDKTESALAVAFEYAQRDCKVNTHHNVLDCQLSGTTATLLVDCPKTGRLMPRRLCIANVGDSRAVLGCMSTTDDGVKSLIAKDLTQDHKPSMREEKTRIQAAGGVVRKQYQNDSCERVFLRNQQCPGLAMSRSIGDTIAASIGVSCTPEVSVLPVERSWQFVLLCSDGIWEFISSQEAVDIVGNCLKSNPQAAQDAANTLFEEGRKRWLEHEKDNIDDITVVCVLFNGDNHR